VTGDFKERRTVRLTPQASPAEEVAYQPCSRSGSPRVVPQGGKQQELQRVAMQKVIFSARLPPWIPPEAHPPAHPCVSTDR